MERNDKMKDVDAKGTTDAKGTIEGNHIDGFYLRDNRDEAKHEEAKHDEARKQVKELYVNLVEDDEVQQSVLPQIEAQLTEGEAESTTHDEATHDEATHDEATHNEATHDEATHDEIIVSDYFTHLNDNGMTYTEHFCFSLKLGACMLFGSVAAIIHAVYPDILTTSTTDTINYIQKELKNRNDMIELQKRIQRELHKIKRQ